MFEARMEVAEGVNFPYYVLGKARLPVSPFTDPWVWLEPSADPFELFARQYGTMRVSLPAIEETWYDWLSATMTVSPGSARGSLGCCRAPLQTVAQGLVGEFVGLWPELEAELTGCIRSCIADHDLRQAVRVNEELFGLHYPAEGRKIFYVTFFPTVAAQQPGPHFVFGVGCLRERRDILRTVEGELGVTLLEQLLTDEAVRGVLPIVEEVTKGDRDVRGPGALLEAVNQVVRAVGEGDGTTTQPLWKPAAEGYGQIVQSLLAHRDLLPKGLRAFVVTSVLALQPH